MALADNIEAYYKIDEASGDTAADCVNSHDLTWSGSPTHMDGVIGKCVELSGTGTKGKNSSFDQGGYDEVTWNFWLYPFSQEGSPVYITTNEDASYGFRACQSDSGTLTFFFGNGSTIKSATAGAMWSKSWKMITCTAKKDDYIKIYVNGVPQNLTAITTFGNSGANFLIGIAYSEAGQNAYARYDEIGVWSRALSQDEITQLYNSGNGLQYPFTTGTNIKLNIGDSWKDVSEMKINIGDSWKSVVKAQVNIGDVWKTIFGT